MRPLVGRVLLGRHMTKDVGKSNVKMALTLGLVAVAFFVSGIYMMISKAGA